MDGTAFIFHHILRGVLKMTTKTLIKANKTWAMIILAILVLTMTACGAKNDSSSTTAAPTTKQEIPLNIGTLKIAALSNLYAAEKLGYFKEEGLKVNFTQMSGGAELLPAVSAGRIDIALSIPSNAIQAREKGFDFQMVMQNEIAAKQGKDSQALFVNANSGISKVADLKGKRISVNAIGNQTWISLVEVLEKNGLGSKDVSFIEVPYPNMEDALANKLVDAVFNVEPFTTKMLSNPAFKTISYPATEALPGQPLGAFWGSEKWLNANKETVTKFVTAINKANQYFKENPDETQKIIAEYTGIDVKVIKAMNPILWDSKVDKATLQSLLVLLKKHGALKKDMDADSILFSTALN
jgi:NitT/TauT family transport system substrate-binding protein